ncbi:MAG: glycoside hydrolase family 32 protein [Planctomycetales bacterium]
MSRYRVFSFLVCLISPLILNGQEIIEFNEKLRPQYHFTAPGGWLNDPNGLVYYQGEYHLFYQHNPEGTNWVPDLSWGHAVSRDLLHWTHLGRVLAPVKLPDGRVSGSWSGTAFIDWQNSARLHPQGKEVLFVAWTAINRGQCLAYSLDKGRSFLEIPNNPVVPHDPNKKDPDRDPKVFWHAPSKQWAMVFSVTGKGMVFYTSPDLHQWTYRSFFPALFECPELFEIGVEGNPNLKKWILWDASSKYFIGEFTGTGFLAETGPVQLDRGKNYYAAQTFSEIPREDGRRISIGWMNGGKFPGMPFNQQMGIPSEIRLLNKPGGLALAKLPLRELQKLRQPPRTWKFVSPEPGKNLWEGVNDELLDVELEFELRPQVELQFNLRGEEFRIAEGKLHSRDQVIPLETVEGRYRCRILLDRTSLEIYWQDGVISQTFSLEPEKLAQGLSLKAKGNGAKIHSCVAYPLVRVWRNQSP